MGIPKRIRKKKTVRSQQKEYHYKYKQKVTRIGRKNQRRSKDHNCSSSKDDFNHVHRKHAATHPINERPRTALNFYKYMWNCNISHSSIPRQICLLQLPLISPTRLQASMPSLNSVSFSFHCPRAQHFESSFKPPAICSVQTSSHQPHSSTSDHFHLCTFSPSAPLLPACHTQERQAASKRNNQQKE